MKKISAYLLIFMSFLLTTTNSNANMFNKFKKGFYFEKYKNAEEAQNALLELHPIGSDVEELVKTLEKAGGKCAIGNKKTNKLVEKILEPDDFYQCYYTEYSIPLVGNYSWRVNIYLNNTDHKTIKEIQVVSGLSAI